ncbi:hypothetical protein Tsubulata_034950 [Turnera subulata]|uniref:Zinc knuckle CX2CX4HX4C domain-containing protein n=1 Tax=Turnera subulata TaxID=218843 RepID=A0A9Q0G8W0_9ROSI|nr:hypothetical protein Tsubulata_034950 [Turnera subulata]
MNERNAVFIANLMSEYLEVDFTSLRGLCLSSTMRVKVRIDVDSPLKPGFMKEDDDDMEYWVQFKYERLPEIYFNCGRMGHFTKTCTELSGIKPIYYYTALKDMRDDGAPQRKPVKIWVDQRRTAPGPSLPMERLASLSLGGHEQVLTETGPTGLTINTEDKSSEQLWGKDKGKQVMGQNVESEDDQFEILAISLKVTIPQPDSELRDKFPLWCKEGNPSPLTLSLFSQLVSS